MTDAKGGREGGRGEEGLSQRSLFVDLIWANVTTITGKTQL